ncbi:MAG: hypothetical protein D6681_21310 [Calditrichaeota bacterium]|nr:MAG: hypothetical protein D6681_21310 [Calditrichota bacterium]
MIFGGGLVAQSPPGNGGIQVTPLSQSWSIDYGGRETNLWEVSTGVRMRYFPHRNLSLSLRGALGATGGDPREIRGPGDLQLDVTWHARSRHLVMGVGINLPSGKKALLPEEFQTSVLLSNTVFRFQVPNFGQGVQVSPHLTWATPLSENVVFGMGAAFKFSGPYRPRSTDSLDYDPGEELLLTAGFDLRLGPAAYLSGDAIVNFYTTDRLGDRDLLSPGPKLTAFLQYRQHFGFHELWLLARYRSRSRNEWIPTSEEFRALPNYGEVVGRFRARLHPMLSVGFLGEARFYGPVDPNMRGTLIGDLSEGSLFGIGLLPQISLTRRIALPLRVKYLKGNFRNDLSLTGWEAGIGLAVQY